MLKKPDYLLEQTGISQPLIGFYDAPDLTEFEPVVSPGQGHACIYAFYKQWLKGKTLKISNENFGCGGASHHLFNQPTRPHSDFIRFLVDEEGLKASHELMDGWVGQTRPYKPEYSNLFIGPLKEDLFKYLKTITFLVNPDQLSMLMIGAQYYTCPGDPEPVIAPFGSGCMQMITGFKDLSVPQAMIGATDMAMRKHLPPDLLALTVTLPMYERLHRLDDKSFLNKGFIKDLKKSRKS